jgi:hypothetical protein
MRVRFTKSLFMGARTYAEGEVAELPDQQARLAIEFGFAGPVKADEKLETATAPQPPLERTTAGAKAKGK